MPKILVIEDDSDMVTALRMPLEANDYEVITASTGQEGLRKVKEIEPDLIILDLIMARMGGEEAFYRLMEINPEARILISSGFARNHLVEELIKEGACGFLGKPFNMHELAKALASHITV